jgi:ferrous iron transport protein A
MLLSELKIAETAKIKRILEGTSALRLMELGIVKGAEVQLRSVAPFGNPIAIQINSSIISLRKEDAALIELESI